MHFLSLDWLVWLALTVAGYWLSPQWARHGLLAAATLGFVVLYDPISAGLLVFFAALTYWGPGARADSIRVWSVITAMVLVLVAFKLMVGNPHDTLNNQGVGLAMPLGMSFYTFRCIHYVLEKYKGTLPQHRLNDFVAYLFFLPTFVIGPIHRFAPFVRDLHRYRWDSQMLSKGMERILYGYVKIAVLNNYLLMVGFAGFIDQLPPSQSALVLYLEVIQTALSIYWLFAGFSDIAIGFALLLGFRVIENFHYPFFQKNIAEFWQSWHISLTSWCRSYIYTSVFAATRSPALGALVTLLVIGFWHDISLSYLVWGLYHGLGVVICQRFIQFKNNIPGIHAGWGKRLADTAGIVLTFHFVALSFTLVREEGLVEALAVYQTLLIALISPLL